MSGVMLRRAPPWTYQVALAAGLAFIALVVLVAVGATHDFDLLVTIAVQSLATGWLDLLVNWHTLLGQLAVTLPAMLLLSVLVWRRFGALAALAPLGLLGTGLVELVFKYGLVHPGPPVEFIRAFINPLGVRVEAPSSFPSGHLARLTFLSVFLAGCFSRRWTWAAATVFIAVALFARVYIGDHWSSDVLGGTALGLSAAATALAWLHATRPPR